MLLEFTCNGRPVRLEADGSMRALDLLRDLLGLTGTKEGCGRGECGACTILLDGRPVNACLLYAAKLHGRAVLTVEGLAAAGAAGAGHGPAAVTAGASGALHPLQEAFLEEGAVQCGYCTPGHAAQRQSSAGPGAAPSGFGNRGGPERQPMPLHRLRQDREGGPAGGGSSGQR